MDINEYSVNSVESSVKFHSKVPLDIFNDLSLPIELERSITGIISLKLPFMENSTKDFVLQDKGYLMNIAQRNENSDLAGNSSTTFYVYAYYNYNYIKYMNNNNNNHGEWRGNLIYGDDRNYAIHEQLDENGEKLTGEIKQVFYGTFIIALLMKDGNAYFTCSRHRRNIFRLELGQWKHLGSDVEMISVGDIHLLLLFKDGRVSGLGYNNMGQITGDDPSYQFPTDVGLSNIKHIACNWASSFALNEDGKLYIWGQQKYGFNIFRDRIRNPQEFQIEGANKFESLIPANNCLIAKSISKEFGLIYGGIWFPIRLKNEEKNGKIIDLKSTWFCDHLIALTEKGIFYHIIYIRKFLKGEPQLYFKKLPCCIDSFSRAWSSLFKEPQTFGFNLIKSKSPKESCTKDEFPFYEPVNFNLMEE